uniref:FA core complex associated protein 100 n=1 Tax=Suricata suricatta TaxID=37032 RepID=A0A673UQP6_SURSU
MAGFAPRVQYLAGFRCPLGGLAAGKPRVLCHGAEIFVSTGSELVYVYDQDGRLLTAVYRFPGRVWHLELSTPRRALYALCAQKGIYCLSLDQASRSVSQGAGDDRDADEDDSEDSEDGDGDPPGRSRAPAGCGDPSGEPLSGQPVPGTPCCRGASAEDGCGARCPELQPTRPPCPVSPPDPGQPRDTAAGGADAAGPAEHRRPSELVRHGRAAAAGVPAAAQPQPPPGVTPPPAARWPRCTWLRWASPPWSTGAGPATSPAPGIGV